jgi:hypothetical protein
MNSRICFVFSDWITWGIKVLIKAPATQTEKAAEEPKPAPTGNELTTVKLKPWLNSK